MTAAINVSVGMTRTTRHRIRCRIAVGFQFVVSEAAITSVESPFGGIDRAIQPAVELIAPLRCPGYGSGSTVCDTWALSIGNLSSANC